MSATPPVPDRPLIRSAMFGVLVVCALAASASAADSPAVAHYQDEIQPILIDYCSRCHADGMKKGGIAFDGFASDEALVAKRELWWSVLKNVRAGIMPPAGKPRPDDKEVQVLADWIKRDVFGIDPQNIDPGRVMIRRLNRVEYRNTVRDLTGFDFKAEEEFPPDDTGYGFDTIGDVLSVSPLLLEKYMQAAEAIVKAAVPTVSRLVPERTYRGSEFHGEKSSENGERLTFYKAAKVGRSLHIDPAGDYEVAADVAVNGAFEFDPGKCLVRLKLDDRELLKETYAWQDGKTYHYTVPLALLAGSHRIEFALEPLTPPEKKKTSVDFRIVAVHLRGPMDPKHWTHPRNFDRYFFKDQPPAADSERRQYAREVLRRFATRAFRRPADDRTLDRLVQIAEGIYQQPGQGFEQGIARAIVAVLASPRFVFRVEMTEPRSSGDSATAFPLVDEYSLAARLSYLLWSSLPDQELSDLAAKGELRKNLAAQVKRMGQDTRAEALVRNFVGQWLLVRDVDGFTINTRAVLRQEGSRMRVDLDGELRRSIRRETEMLFAHIEREDRSLLELIDCDYTFLNAKLAQLYGIKDVTGNQMRRVKLPKDSPRGGVLAHASVLLVTSNPTRTSPVKRGQFILDNILGTPTPPPPPDIPALEDAKKQFKDREPTVRELMVLHRSKALCASCHSRMDPLGLALENFNAFGLWRDKERGQPIDASGKLITGESFHDVRDLKRIVKEGHRLDFYRCVTEKLLTYALGRGLDYNDVETVDRIVQGLDREGGRFSALLMGVIESAPFQKRRSAAAAAVGPGRATQPASPTPSKISYQPKVRP